MSDTEDYTVWEDDYQEVIANGKDAPDWLAKIKQSPNRWLYITSPEAKLGPGQAAKLQTDAKKYGANIKTKVKHNAFLKMAVLVMWEEKGNEK